MRKVLVFAALLLVAAPALAYVQPGTLGTKSAVEGDKAPREQSDGAGGGDEQTLTEYPEPIEDRTTVKPVPEPGTMALASMGLLAIGAALRKRRNR